MKSIRGFICVPVFLFCCVSSKGQKYTSFSDTIKLNKEYLKVRDEINNLNARLIEAQNNVSMYNSASESAAQNAKNAADNSSNEAHNASGGNLRDAEKAKDKAKKAYKKAKRAKKANDAVENNNQKIGSLTRKIARKQDRLNELEAMRTSINAGLLQ